MNPSYQTTMASSIEETRKCLLTIISISLFNHVSLKGLGEFQLLAKVSILPP